PDSFRHGSSRVPPGSRTLPGVRLQFLRPQRTLERVSIELVVALDADIERAVALRPRHAQQDIAIAQLAAVEGDALALIDRAIQQLGWARDAPALSAAL